MLFLRGKGEGCYHFCLLLFDFCFVCVSGHQTEPIRLVKLVWLTLYIWFYFILTQYHYQCPLVHHAHSIIHQKHAHGACLAWDTKNRAGRRGAEVVLLSCYRADQAGDGGRWPAMPAPVVFSQSASHSLSQLWHFLGTPQALWVTSLHFQSLFRFIMFTLVALWKDVCFMHALHLK